MKPLLLLAFFIAAICTQCEETEGFMIRENCPPCDEIKPEKYRE